MSDKSSLKLIAYNKIKEKIINCEYPPSFTLNEGTLRDELNISRTPIRDALSRLEQDGLISIIPKKGILVSDLSIYDINLIFEVRLLCEPYVIKNYGSKLDQDILYKYFDIFSNCSNLNDDEIFKIDDEFHSILMSVCENPYLIRLHDQISNQNSRLRVLTGQFDTQRLNNTAEEHLEILRALLKREWAEASEAMQKHLLMSKNASFDLLLNDKN